MTQAKKYKNKKRSW